MEEVSEAQRGRSPVRSESMAILTRYFDLQPYRIRRGIVRGIVRFLEDQGEV